MDYKSFYEKEYQDKQSSNAVGWNDDKVAQSQKEIIFELLGDKFSDINNGLDLGCGDGRLTCLLAKEGLHMNGIDISETAIEWAEKRASELQLHVHFDVGSVLELPYADNNFDLVIDSLCLHCIIGEDRNKFFEEVKRVMKPNGYFIVMTKTGTPDFSTSLRRRFDPISRIAYFNDEPNRYWGTEEGLIHEIESKGFTIHKHEIKHYEENDSTGLFVALVTQN